LKAGKATGKTGGGYDEQGAGVGPFDDPDDRKVSPYLTQRLRSMEEVLKARTVQQRLFEEACGLEDAPKKSASTSVADSTEL
jgi:hypothetical protein